MNANFDLRRSICKIHPAHARMVDTARQAGVSAKFCGSGGAIIGICPEGAAYDRLCDAMHACGASVVRPIVGVIHGARTGHA
jgi:glucuronokinase